MSLLPVPEIILYESPTPLLPMKNMEALDMASTTLTLERLAQAFIPQCKTTDTAI
jgi:hypothetical protein